MFFCSLTAIGTTLGMVSCMAWPVSVSACQWPCWQNGSRSSRLIDAGQEICCRTCFLGLHHLVFLRKALLLQRQKRMTETKWSYWGGQKNETNGKAFPGIREACAGTDRGKRNQGIRLGLRSVREQDNIIELKSNRLRLWKRKWTIRWSGSSMPWERTGWSRWSIIATHADRLTNKIKHILRSKADERACRTTGVPFLCVQGFLSRKEHLLGFDFVTLSLFRRQIGI